MSPEIFEALVLGERIQEEDLFLNETFAIGMIVLECGLFKGTNRFYSKSKGKFKKEKFRKAVEEFQEKFLDTPALGTGLKLCLQTISQRRRSAGEILKAITECTEFISELSFSESS